MDLMTTAWTALSGSAAGAAASGVGAAGAAGSMFGGGGSFVQTLLSGAQSVLGAMSSLNAGEAKARALERQAQQAEFEAGQEAIKGIERRVSLKRDLFKTLGEQQTAYGASGVDMSFGTPQKAQDAAVDDANRALTLDSGNEEIKRAGFKQKAGAYRDAAKEAQDGAFYGALSPLFSFAQNTMRRGSR